LIFSDRRVKKLITHVEKEVLQKEGEKRSKKGNTKGTRRKQKKGARFNGEKPFLIWYKEGVCRRSTEKEVNTQNPEVKGGKRTKGILLHSPP